MSHNPRTSINARIVGVNAQLWLCNGGTLTVYDEPQVKTLETPQTGNILVSFKLPTPAFDSAAGEGTDVVAKSRPIDPVEIQTDGKARCFRVYQKDGTTGVWSGTCGKGPSFDMNFKTTDLVAGALLDLTGQILYRIPME